MDSGASGLYFALNAPVINTNPVAPEIAVGTATGQIQKSTATGQLALPNLPTTFPTTGHKMPGFSHTLLGVGPICDADCTVTFRKDSVVVRDATNRFILTGWIEAQAPYLWRIALIPDNMDIPKVPQDALRVSLVAYSAYDLPSVEALVRYFHASAGFPVRFTWIDAIKAGNYALWPGLTINNARRYCPSANETILGHLVQGRQGVCSTTQERRGARYPATPATMTAPPGGTSDNQLLHAKELHIQVRHISKLYTDDTGRFPVRARSSNQYVMIAYNCDLNVILAFPFSSIKYIHRLVAYNNIM